MAISGVVFAFEAGRRLALKSSKLTSLFSCTSMANSNFVAPSGQMVRKVNVPHDFIFPKKTFGLLIKASSPHFTTLPSLLSQRKARRRGALLLGDEIVV